MTETFELKSVKEFGAFLKEGKVGTLTTSSKIYSSLSTAQKCCVLKSAANIIVDEKSKDKELLSYILLNSFDSADTKTKVNILLLNHKLYVRAAYGTNEFYRTGKTVYDRINECKDKLKGLSLNVVISKDNKFIGKTALSIKLSDLKKAVCKIRVLNNYSKGEVEYFDTQDFRHKKFMPYEGYDDKSYQYMTYEDADIHISFKGTYKTQVPDKNGVFVWKAYKDDEAKNYLMDSSYYGKVFYDNRALFPEFDSNSYKTNRNAFKFNRKHECYNFTHDYSDKCAFISRLFGLDKDIAETILNNEDPFCELDDSTIWNPDYINPELSLDEINEIIDLGLAHNPEIAVKIVEMKHQKEDNIETVSFGNSIYFEDAIYDDEKLEDDLLDDGEPEETPDDYIEECEDEDE